MNHLNLFLPCAAGVEDYLAAEVTRITGETAVQKWRAGVALQASWRDALKLNLHCRLAQRVLVHLWHDGAQWRREFVGQRCTPFALAGRGSLQIPISRPEIAIAPDDSIIMITRDAEAGGGIRLARSGRAGERWEETTLHAEDLGDWEPTYDLNRLRDTGILSLFVLPVRQGNHETVTTFPSQEALVLEVALG